MFFDEKRIVIDESLDPDENPAKECRGHVAQCRQIRRLRALASCTALD